MMQWIGVTPLDDTADLTKKANVIVEVVRHSGTGMQTWECCETIEVARMALDQLAFAGTWMVDILIGSHLTNERMTR